jgi:hypothetical protein
LRTLARVEYCPYIVRAIGNHRPMFEQAFENIDDVPRKEAGCTTELRGRN